MISSCFHSPFCFAWTTSPYRRWGFLDFVFLLNGLIESFLGNPRGTIGSTIIIWLLYSNLITIIFKFKERAFEKYSQSHFMQFIHDLEEVMVFLHHLDKMPLCLFVKPTAYQQYHKLHQKYKKTIMGMLNFQNELLGCETKSISSCIFLFLYERIYIFL